MAKRILFEFEDLPWFPDNIREGMTDYLRYFLTVSDFYSPVLPVLENAIKKTGDTDLVDLCSGGGGSIQKIGKQLNNGRQNTVKITLTDKFPNVNAFKFLQRKSGGDLNFIEYSVDAGNVPQSIKGFRTIFSGIHHFDDEATKAVLQNAVESGRGIGIFDGGDKNVFTMLGILIFHPIAFFLFTPFFRPFRFSRIIYTYILPLIPLCTVWDGIVSIMRLYEPKDLLEIAKSVNNDSYYWEAGKLRNKYFMNVTYLVGYPKAG